MEIQNIELEKQVWKEADLLDLLGLKREQLDRLRLERGFPCVYLSQRNRVFLAADVLDYLQKAAKRQTQQE